MGFKIDTLAKLFGLQNQTLIFDKITILSKARHHQNVFLTKKLLSSNMTSNSFRNFPEKALKFFYKC